MKLRVALGGLAVLAAVGVGLGTYFALQPSHSGCVLKAHDQLFDRARTLGIISCYRSSGWGATVADGGEFMVRVIPSHESKQPVRINYQVDATRRAGQMARLIHRLMPDARVSLAPAGVFP